MRLIVLAAFEAWIVPNTRCPVSAAWTAASNVSHVAHLADQDHVRVLADGVLEGRVPVAHVEADLALVDDRHLVGEDELDRVLDGEDVQRLALR